MLGRWRGLCPYPELRNKAEGKGGDGFGISVCEDAGAKD